MHARELVELAALVAVHAPLLVDGPSTIAAESVEEYWIGSKCRFDRWARSLKELMHQASDPQSPGPSGAPLCGVVEEILSGEVLTRVWTATMCAYDRHRGTDLVEPVVRSVLIGHIEARHRVLTLLVSGPGLNPAEALRLNCLRNQTDRWTDVLLAHLAAHHDVREFAVDPARVKDFAEDLAYQSRQEGGKMVWPLVLGSIRAAFRQGLIAASPNPDLNAKIAAGIVACFPADLFNSTGLLHSLWLERIARIANDAQGMIDDLLAPEGQGSWERLLDSGPKLPPGRSRRLGT